MAPPKSPPGYVNPYANTISDYYMSQYMQTHYARYNQMVAIAQSEAQLSLENQMAQRKLMAAQAKDLRRYVTAMERDLTNYIDRKGSSSATEDMALLRMYVDVQKAKAQQSAQAQQRRIAIDKAADSHYAPNSSTVRAITTAGEEIQSRVAVAGTDQARKNIAIVEIGKIAVQEPGSGAAVAEAQSTLNTIKQAYVKAGVPGSFTASEEEIKTAIYNHYGLGGYRAQTNRKGDAIYVVPSGNDIFDMDIQENVGKVKKTKRTEEGAAVTGGLNKAQTAIMDKMAGKGKSAPTAEEVKQAVAIFQSHPDYGILVDELSQDGQITEDEYVLFSDRIEVEGKQGPPKILTYYAQLKNNPATQTAEVPEYQKLIFDPNFIRKVGQLGEYQTELETAETAAAAPLQMERWESIQQRGREYYDPVRMAGSPRAGQQIQVRGTDGQQISIPISQLKDMSRDFDNFLLQNPEMAHDFKLIQEGYGMASGLEPPKRDLSKNSAQHIGYQMHVQYNKKDLGQIKDPLEFYKIATEISGGDKKKRDDIVKWFHAYNMVPQRNAMAGVELSPAGSSLRDQFLADIEEQAKADEAAALAAEKEAASAKIIEEWKGPSIAILSNTTLAPDVYKQAKENPNAVVKVLYEGENYFLTGAQIAALGTEKDGIFVPPSAADFQSGIYEAIVTRDVTIDPRNQVLPGPGELMDVDFDKKPKPGKQPVEDPKAPKVEVKKTEVKEEVVEEAAPVQPFTQGQAFGPTNAWHYQLAGYDETGQPLFHGHTKTGRYGTIVYSPTSTGSGKAGYDEAMKWYNQELKKLEK